VPETTLHLDEDTFVEPGFVFFWKSDGLAGLKPETCPLAIEVADSRQLYDLNRKARVCAAFAVREAWVIDPQTLVTHVCRRPGLEGHRDNQGVAVHEELVEDFAPSLAVAPGALQLI